MQPGIRNIPPSGLLPSPLPADRYVKQIPFVDDIFVKRFFIAKTSYTYTMNYLHQEKHLRDHEAIRGPIGMNYLF
jgi:hypothetical protein